MFSQGYNQSNFTIFFRKGEVLKLTGRNCVRSVIRISEYLGQIVYPHRAIRFLILKLPPKDKVLWVLKGPDQKLEACLLRINSVHEKKERKKEKKERREKREEKEKIKEFYILLSDHT